MSRSFPVCYTFFEIRSLHCHTNCLGVVCLWVLCFPPLTFRFARSVTGEGGCRGDGCLEERPPLWCVRVGAGVLLFGCFGLRVVGGGWLSMLGANFNGVRVSFAYSIFISSRRSGMSPACHCLCHALSFAVTCSSCCGSRFDARVMFLVGNYYSRWSLFVSRFTFVAHGLFRIGNYYSSRVCFTVCF